MFLTQELALKQSLVLNQEMRLAIDILAMSSTEIDALIEKELLENPLLDKNEDYSEPENYSFKNSQGEHSAFEVAMAKAANPRDFREHLLHQVGVENFNCLEKEIAEHLINNLDDDGFLKNYEALKLDLVKNIFVHASWVDIVRQKIMRLEPLACGSLNIYESLGFQAKCKKINLAKKFLETLNLLVDNENHTKALTLLRQPGFRSELSKLKCLSPKPAYNYSDPGENDGATLPDVMVTIDQNDIKVSLLKNASKRICLNEPPLGRDSLKKEEKKYIVKKIQRAKFLANSLLFRDNHVLAVSKIIALHQRKWFLGLGPLAPLNLRQVSENVDIHESSVSRIVKNKFLFCDRGFFSLKYFFSGAINSSANGSSGSSAAHAKEMIQQIVQQENKSAPFSDQKICELLKKKNVEISRRTVTKYREHLKILSASQRRVFTKL